MEIIHLIPCICFLNCSKCYQRVTNLSAIIIPTTSIYIHSMQIPFYSHRNIFDNYLPFV